MNNAVQTGHIEIDGFKLKYLIEGKGPDTLIKGLESLDRPVLLVYGRFEFLIDPVYSWDPLKPKFKNLTVRIFEKSAHSPQYEESDLFDTELLEWLLTRQVNK